MVKMTAKHSAMVLMKPMASSVGDQGDLSVAYYHANQLSSYQDLRIRRMHGPRRVIAFCLLIAVLPTILLVIPLYLRHSVYADVAYEVTESEVLKIVEGISSIFCQEHSLKMNSTFTAYQLGHEPTLSPHRKHIHMKKSMLLPDDTLEYWGFYLLNGSSMTLSICSRFEGGRVMVVRGERNLKTCGLLDRDKKASELPIGVVGKEGVGGNKVRVIFDNKPGITHKGPKGKPTTTASPTTVRKPEMDIADGEVIDIDGTEVSEAEEVNEEDLEVVKSETKEVGRERSREEGYDVSEEEDADGSGDFDDDEELAALLRKLERRKALKRQQKKLKEPKQKDEDSARRKRHLKVGNDGIRRRKRDAVHSQRLERLRRELVQEKHREKREEVELVDGGLKHGGTALNYTKQESEDDSESSFELGLRECYGGDMEFQEEFSPSETCSENVDSKDSKEVSQPFIRIEHEISSNGYYYYIFYSDNDLVTNEVHAAFDLQKTVYEKTSNKSDNPGHACVNATECIFPISFFSGSIVIVEIPTRDGIDRDIMDEVDGPQGAVLISSCHPRMSVYIIFPVAVLFLILGCAFL